MGEGCGSRDEEASEQAGDAGPNMVRAPPPGGLAGRRARSNRGAMNDGIPGDRDAREGEDGAFVTVLASSRVPFLSSPSGTPFEAEARALGARLVEAGLAVMTGGGGGLMEAVNQGAREAALRHGGAVAARSLGCRVTGGRESAGRYLDLCDERPTLAARKARLLEGRAIVALPGGFGTLDEVFEALALMQRQEFEVGGTGLRPLAPRVILHPRPFWAPLVTWLEGSLLAAGTIDGRDRGRLQLTDTVDEVVAAVRADVLTRKA